MKDGCVQDAGLYLHQHNAVACQNPARDHSFSQDFVPSITLVIAVSCTHCQLIVLWNRLASGIHSPLVRRYCIRLVSL